MRVSLTIDNKSFDLGHMSLVDLIDRLEDIGMNEPLLERLAHHPDPCVRIAVSRKQYLNPKTVRFLHEENSIPEIQKNIMTFHHASPGMTKEAFMRLVDEGGGELLGIVRRVDKLSLSAIDLESLIVSLISHPDSKVRMALAKNSRLPEWALEKLTQDADNLVVQWAYRTIGMQKAISHHPEQESVLSAIGPKAFISISNLMFSNYNELQNLYAGEAEGFHWDERGKQETGIGDFDLMTGGLKKGEVTLIGGCQGQGTTSLAVNIAVGVGLRSDYQDEDGGGMVALFSMQHCEEELSMRILAFESRVDFEKMRLGQFTSEAWRKLAVASGVLAESHIQVMHDPDLSIYEAMYICKQMRQPPDLVIIDRLDLMNPFTGEQEFGEISEIIRKMANELNVPVLLTVTLPKQVINQATFRGWSKSLFDGADTVMLLERHDKDASLNMYKHIALPASLVKLHFNDGNMRFDSIADSWCK